MLSDRVFGAAGREILIEEFMDGEEISLFAITDGVQALPLLAASSSHQMTKRPPKVVVARPYASKLRTRCRLDLPGDREIMNRPTG